MWGKNDKLFPVEYAKRWGERIPGSRVEIVPDCGHVPAVEKPECHRESDRSPVRGDALMQFTFFHLMPYRPLDMAERHKHRAAWVVLPNALYDPKKGADEYQSYIDQLVYAEKLGFDVIAVNEHHQTAYGLMPAPNLIAANLIARTSKVKIAIVGRALPLVNNPVNIAEEFAMLDNLSKGRIITGFVRGIGNEYHATGINPYWSHERFQEAHDLIVQAWTRPGPFAFEGEHYNLRYVNLWPRPYQTPHPPIWIPSMGSSETIKWAADAGAQVSVPGDVQRPRSGGALSQPLSRAGPAIRLRVPRRASSAGPRRSMSPTPTRAPRKRPGPAWSRCSTTSCAVPFQMLLPPGYTSLSSMKNTMRMRKQLGAQKRHSLEELMESGTVVVGSPKTVRDELSRAARQDRGEQSGHHAAVRRAAGRADPSATWSCSPPR